MPDFPWYTAVSSRAPLEQGDLLDGFPIITPSIELVDPSGQPANGEVSQTWVLKRFNVVVLTQSCDFQKLDDQDEIILCPRFDYVQFAKDFPRVGGKSGWKNLVSRRVIDAYLINKCDIPHQEFDYQVISLRQVFPVPLGLAKRVAEKQGDRVRLLSPYREALAQAFAEKFMRVGLPIDLPREYPY